MYGDHPGMLQLVDEYDSVFWKTYKPSGKIPPLDVNHSDLYDCREYAFLLGFYDWEKVEVRLPFTNLFVIEAVRGGQTLAEDKGDICVDNIHLYKGFCSALQ